MADISFPHTITNGSIPDADDVQDNFNAITAQVNGNLDEDNINPAANIPSSAIDFAADSIGPAEIAAPVVTEVAPGGDSTGVTTLTTVCSTTAPSTGYYDLYADSQFSVIVGAAGDHETLSLISVAGSQVGKSKQTRIWLDSTSTGKWADTIYIPGLSITSGQTIALVHSRSAANLKTIAAGTSLKVRRVA